MFGSGVKTIGLTLDQTGARIVKLKKKKNWEIDSVSVLPLPAGFFEEDLIASSAELAKELSQWVKANKLQGLPVTISFPASHVIVRRLRIQSKTSRDLPGLVSLEVETTLHLPFEDPIYDYVKVDEDEENTQVLVFAASRQLIQKYADLLEGAGLKVSGAELSATALARAIRELSDEKFAETMLINLDANLLEIYLFHNGHPVFLKTISLYGHEGAQGAAALDPGQLAEVTAEIARMLNFYQFSIHEGNTRITETLIVGSGEGRRQLLAELQTAQPDMSVRAISFEPFAPGGNADASRVAIGLALWNQDKQKINLLPRIDREARLYPVIAAGALALWLLAAGAVGYFYFDSKSQFKANALSLQQLSDQVALLTSNLAAKNKAEVGQSNPLEVIEKIRGGRRDAIAVLDELNSKLPRDALIKTVSYSSFGQIGLTVQIKDYDEASRYLYDLRQMSFSASVQLQSVTQNGQTDGPAVDTLKSAAYSLEFTKPKGGQTTDGSSANPAQ